MGQLDGVGRIYRPDLDQNVNSDLQVDRTEHERKRRDKDEQKDDGPHDTVDIHDEEGTEATPEPQATEPADGPEPEPEPEPKPDSADSEDDGLDISA